LRRAPQAAAIRPACCRPGAPAPRPDALQRRRAPRTDRQPLRLFKLVDAESTRQRQLHARRVRGLRLGALQQRASERPRGQRAEDRDLQRKRVGRGRRRDADAAGQLLQQRGLHRGATLDGGRRGSGGREMGGGGVTLGERLRLGERLATEAAAGVPCRGPTARAAPAPAHQTGRRRAPAHLRAGAAAAALLLLRHVGIAHARRHLRRAGAGRRRAEEGPARPRAQGPAAARPAAAAPCCCARRRGRCVAGVQPQPRARAPGAPGAPPGPRTLPPGPPSPARPGPALCAPRPCPEAEAGAGGAPHLQLPGDAPLQPVHEEDVIGGLDLRAGHHQGGGGGPVKRPPHGPRAGPAAAAPPGSRCLCHAGLGLQPCSKRVARGACFSRARGHLGAVPRRTCMRVSSSAPSSLRFFAVRMSSKVAAAPTPSTPRASSTVSAPGSGSPPPCAARAGARRRGCCCGYALPLELRPPRAQGRLLGSDTRRAAVDGPTRSLVGPATSALIFQLLSRRQKQRGGATQDAGQDQESRALSSLPSLLQASLTGISNLLPLSARAHRRSGWRLWKRRGAAPRMVHAGPLTPHLPPPPP
jgi:hypothetical protein